MVTSGARPNTNQTRPMSLQGLPRHSIHFDIIRVSNYDWPSSHRPINQKSAQSDFNYGIFRRLIAQDTIEQMADFSVLNHKLRHSGTYQPAVRTRRCNPLSSARITPLASRMSDRPGCIFLKHVANQYPDCRVSLR